MAVYLVVDGVVAMAYPPRDQHTPRAPTTGPGDLQEDFPPLRLLNTRPNYRNIVHLDLDPQNRECDPALSDVGSAFSTLNYFKGPDLIGAQYS